MYWEVIHILSNLSKVKQNIKYPIVHQKMKNQSKADIPFQTVGIEIDSFCVNQKYNHVF